MVYRIIESKCISCGDCENECPVACIALNEDFNMEIDESRCTGCGICAEVCPADGIISVE